MSRPPGLDQSDYDDSFRRITGSPELTAAAAEVSIREHLRGDVRRIASSLFCAAALDPTVVSFAMSRAAARWLRNEEEIDVMVAAQLLRTATVLRADLE